MVEMVEILCPVSAPVSRDERPGRPGEGGGEVRILRRRWICGHNSPLTPHSRPDFYQLFLWLSDSQLDFCHLFLRPTDSGLDF